MADEKTVSLRLDTCALCPLRDNIRCSKCGCYIVEAGDNTGKAVPGKAFYEVAECPLGFWKQAEQLGHPVIPQLSPKEGI